MGKRMEIEEKLKLISNHYGMEKQVEKAVEEFEELIEVLQEYPNFDLDNLLSEMADSTNMLIHLGIYIQEQRGISVHDAITNLMHKKADREIERVRANSKKSSANRYRKKPLVVEAWKWTGKMESDMPVWLHKAFGQGLIGIYNSRVKIYAKNGDTYQVDNGDYIIRGIDLELYQCPPAVFEETYERLDG